ncbi:MAG: EamA family transporter, partial [Clostridiales bacterium]
MVQLFAGLLVGIIFLAIKGEHTLDIDSTSWFWILILGLVNTGLGCYLYFSPMNVLS